MRDLPTAWAKHVAGELHSAGPVDLARAGPGVSGPE